jgi:hypothetical protein
MLMLISKGIFVAPEKIEELGEKKVCGKSLDLCRSFLGSSTISTIYGDT